MNELPLHLLNMRSLTRDHIEKLIQRANYFLTQGMEKNSVFETLKGHVVANLFFEPSTRTRNSFEIAAKRLGAMVLNPNLKTSAISKGETLFDTIKTLEAMGVYFFIVRHSENETPEQIAKQLSSGVVINAGDGNHQHPSQALIDLMTIKQHKPHWNKLCVTIIGDIRHSRVANSLMDGLVTMGVPEIRLVGPSSLLPDKVGNDSIKKFTELKPSLLNSDVIVTLRLQKERHDNSVDIDAFRGSFRLTPEKLYSAKPDAIVMHPGPVNREVEINSDVADNQQSVILQQVRNGVAMRMAVLELFLLRDFRFF